MLIKKILKKLIYSYLDKMTFKRDESIDLKGLNNNETDKPKAKVLFSLFRFPSLLIHILFPLKEKWTLNLLICCLTASTASLQFGFNLSSLNTITIVCNNLINI